MRYMRYILDIAFYAKQIVIFTIESRETEKVIQSENSSVFYSTRLGKSKVKEMTSFQH